jgi:hypothetical protein
MTFSMLSDACALRRVLHQPVLRMESKVVPPVLSWLSVRLIGSLVFCLLKTRIVLSWNWASRVQRKNRLELPLNDDNIQS